DRIGHAVVGACAFHHAGVDRQFALDKLHELPDFVVGGASSLDGLGSSHGSAVDGFVVFLPALGRFHATLHKACRCDSVRERQRGIQIMGCIGGGLGDGQQTVEVVLALG